MIGRINYLERQEKENERKEKSKMDLIKFVSCVEESFILFHLCGFFSCMFVCSFVSSLN